MSFKKLVNIKGVKMQNGLETLIDNLSMLEKLYDVVRIVEPLKKKDIYYEANEVEISNSGCYEFWKFKKHCPNCVSMRAYNENDTFVKFEYNKEKIYMIMASPIFINEDKYVVEMLKDVTNTGVIENFCNKTTTEIQSFLNEMNDKVIKDELTGLYNRRFINERLPIDILKNISLESPLSLVILDIDFFKSINDNYGHSIGDSILSNLALLINNSIKKERDWVARYGGEEFIIVLDNTDNDTAYRISEEIRKKVEEKVFEYEGNRLKITISLGIYTLDKDTLDKNSFDVMINYADKKLYEAKGTGRNRTIK